MKITVKGDNISLRACLEREGFRFPCGGKGSCGRCRIVAPALPVTDRDRKFLNADDIARGVRIACDKTVNGTVEIEAETEKGEVRAERFERADAYAVFADNATYIGLQDGGEVLDGSVLSPVEAKYAYLRGAAQKETIELFEKHSLAKADTFLLAASPARFSELTGIPECFGKGLTFGAELIAMPAVDVYLPPRPKALVGSDILLEFVSREEGEFVVSGRYFAYLDEASFNVAYVASDDVAFRTATVLWFIKKFAPVRAKYIGIDPVSEACGLEGEKSQIPANAAAALDSNRFKAKLEKLARKAEEISLADDELFQEILTEITA